MDAAIAPWQLAAGNTGGGRMTRHRTRRRGRMIAAAAMVVAAAWSADTASAETRSAVPNYRVVVTLSPAAAREMATKREEIIVSASYYGEPTKTAKKEADEMGQIDLGGEDVRLGSAGGTAAMVGKGFRAARIVHVVGREAHLNLNVYSARRSGPDNLLDCDFFDDTVKLAESKPIAIHCKLIGEN